MERENRRHRAPGTGGFLRFALARRLGGHLRHRSIRRRGRQRNASPARRGGPTLDPCRPAPRAGGRHRHGARACLGARRPDRPARRQGSFRRHFPFRRPPKRADVICRARCVPLRRPRRRTALQVDGRVGRVLTFPGPRHAYHLAQRYDGLRREVERNPGLNEVVACIDSDLAAGVVELIRHAGPIDGIYVGSEQIVEVAKALVECELRIPCVGFTNSEEVEPFVKSGVVSAIVDESRFQQGYFAVQKAYEAAAKRGAPAPPGIRIPCSVVLASNLREAGAAQSLNEAFERLIFQRTADIIAHQRMLQEANAKLENLANTDPLTGLFNRRRNQEALQYEVDRARRYGMVSLMMSDLNWFKLLNDQYGHNAGDEALKTVAELLKSRCRSTDICARLGGDEFAVILPQTGADGSAIVRQSILDLIEQTRLPWQGEELHLSLSAGIATLFRETTAPEDLMAAADADMYRQKIARKANRPGPVVNNLCAPTPAPHAESW